MNHIKFCSQACQLARNPAGRPNKDTLARLEREDKDRRIQESLSRLKDKLSQMS